MKRKEKRRMRHEENKREKTIAIMEKDKSYNARKKYQQAKIAKNKHNIIRDCKGINQPVNKLKVKRKKEWE